MQTKNHCLRLPDDVWAEWQAQAKQEGLTVTDMLRAAVPAYANRGAVPAGAPSHMQKKEGGPKPHDKPKCQCKACLRWERENKW